MILIKLVWMLWCVGLIFSISGHFLLFMLSKEKPESSRVITHASWIAIIVLVCLKLAVIVIPTEQ